MSAVHDAMNQLQRSAIAAERQALFLHACHRRGLHADAPGKPASHITVPKLLSPWAAPAPPDKTLLDKLGVLGQGIRVVEGGVEEVYGSAIGLANMTVALTAMGLNKYAPALAKAVPGLAKKGEQLSAGLKWAWHHKEKFLKMIAQDMVSWKLWRKGDYARAIGHNVVGFTALFLGVAKLSKGGAAALKGLHGEKTALKLANVKRTKVEALRGDNAGLHSPGSAPHLAPALRRAENDARWAHERIETARLKTVAAREDVGDAVKDIKADLAKKAKGYLKAIPLAPAGIDPPKEKP
jgi:hypothetical protein